MKSLFLALLFASVGLCVTHAIGPGGDPGSSMPGDHGDDDDKKSAAAPEEIPDFNHLDEYIYQPKSVLNYGFRFSGGIKASFSGNGTIASPEASVDTTSANISRTYHDGKAEPDSRVVSVSNGAGTTVSTPITPDGKTNTWGYDSASQITSDGFMQFHLYSAATKDTQSHEASRKGDLGWELTVAHNMGHLTKNLSWNIFGGMSVNDIQAANASSVLADVHTLTDTYNLFGQTPPAAPYNAPSTSTQTVVDASGNPVTNSTGAPVTQSVDTSTLLGNAPINSVASDSLNTTQVVNHYKLHGSYATFRGGPQFVYNFSERLHLNVSVGPALIYAGSNYTVTEVLLAPTGGDIIDTMSDTTSRVLFGYYGDVTLNYDLTDRSGLYIGGFYQSAGSYTQNVSNTGAVYGATTGPGLYSTKVEFNNTEGVRTGVSFKF